MNASSASRSATWLNSDVDVPGVGTVRLIMFIVSSGVPGRLTSGHFLVTTLTNSKRHALLRVLGVLTQAAFPEDPMASFPAERKPELCREK